MADVGLIRQDQRMATRRVLKRIFAAVAIVVLLVIMLTGAMLFAIWRSERAIAAVPLDPANYRAAAPDLVRLCQTDPKLIRQKFSGVDPDQIPSIAKLKPEVGGISVDPASATVVWGGGFYHAGWRLDRSPDQGADAANHTWTLSFWDEGDRRGHVLQRFTMPVDARFTAAPTRPAGP
jgi:hypothetical protein